MYDNKTVAEITSEDYRTAVIFKKYGIDFCCGGKKSIQDACIDKNVSLVELTEALEISTQNLITEHNYYDWELDYLIDHIIKTHHTYINNKLPEIKPFLDKVLKKHGERHPELKNVYQFFNQVSQELVTHMQKEENILFPYIKQLVTNKKENKNTIHPPFGTIKSPITMMELEHEQVGDIFKEIKIQTNNLVPPIDGCKTYKIVFLMLDELWTDLQLHIHLENNILFPKSIKLEEEIFL